MLCCVCLLPFFGESLFLFRRRRRQSGEGKEERRARWRARRQSEKIREEKMDDDGIEMVGKQRLQ